MRTHLASSKINPNAAHKVIISEVGNLLEGQAWSVIDVVAAFCYIISYQHQGYG